MIKINELWRYVMLIILFYALGTFIFIFTIVSVILIFCEEKKLRINPIPKLKNNDRRFTEIQSKYCHKVYSVKRGK